MTKRRSKWRTESGFRLIPQFSVEHNAARFMKHVERRCKLPEVRRGAASSRAKMRARKAQGYT